MRTFCAPGVILQRADKIFPSLEAKCTLETLTETQSSVRVAISIHISGVETPAQISGDVGVGEPDCVLVGDGRCKEIRVLLQVNDKFLLEGVYFYDMFSVIQVKIVVKMTPVMVVVIQCNWKANFPFHTSNKV